ncbi:hypothetical protein [Burkholderia gladioli]|uniref:hypothetical protein n=1 Tax=Burkholderia gladioli TaxID=28095 RepID=UPI003EDF978C
MSSWSMPSFAGRRRAVLRLLGRSLLALGVGAAVASYSSAALARDTVSIGYQRSSTLFILLKRNGELSGGSACSATTCAGTSSPAGCWRR